MYDNPCGTSNDPSCDCNTLEYGTMSDECSEAMKLSDLLPSSRGNSGQVLQDSSAATTVVKPSGDASQTKLLSHNYTHRYCRGLRGEKG